MHFTSGLRRAAQQHPNGIATVFNGRVRRYRQLESRVACLAGALIQLGVLRGDSVALACGVSDNRIEALLATAWAGAVATPLDPEANLPELIGLLNNAQSVAVVIDDRLAAEVDSLLDACPYIRRVIFCGDGPCPEFAQDLQALITATDPIADHETGGDDLFSLVYPDATSDQRHGVLLSHRVLGTAALALMAEGIVPDEAIGLTLVPPSDPASLVFGSALVMRGGRQVLLPGFDAAAAVATIAEHRVSDLLIEAGQLAALLDAATEASLDSLQRIVHTGGPLPAALLERVLKQLPSIQLFSLYGPAELAGVAAVLPPARMRKQSLGRSVCQIELRVIDNTGRELPRGATGELVARGPNLMLGLHEQPEASHQRLRRGWVHTGQMAQMDEDGFIVLIAATVTRNAENSIRLTAQISA